MFNHNTMKTKLIRIGNSQGVRIPKPIIEEIGLSKEIDMILEENQIILRSSQDTREGWDQSFQQMSDKCDDTLLDKEAVEKLSQWDKSEWTW